MLALPKFKVHEVATESEISLARDHLDWPHQLLSVPSVWRKTQGSGVTVAVLDTGVDPDHPDLQGAISKMADFTGDGIEDESGHGTHCAGVIGARLNRVGLVGVAPKCNLIIGKVLGNSGGGTYDWIADGVDWAVDQQADIISMSLGGPGSNHRLFKSIHSALTKGKIVVCAAGNSGSIFSNTIGYPGKYGGVITVAAHDVHGRVTGFSSRGGEVDFAGPGEAITSAYRDGKYATLSGTSMATPFVSGICALIMSARPGYIKNCEDMRNQLMKMAAHPGCHDPSSGYGPLNVASYF